MRDPFLYAHQMGPRIYSIGGKMFPISFRDQMLRGQLFVDRAVERGELEPRTPNHYPLLIIGAGVAGLSAALRALEIGVRVLLVEQKDQALCVQATCDHRWISPTLYDFPVDHWRADQFPWPPPAPPPPSLAWRASPAHKLVVGWRSALGDAAAKHQGLLTPRWNSKVDLANLKPDPLGRFIAADVVTTDPLTGRKYSDPDNPHEVAIVLLAVGFGDEKRYLRPPNSPKHPTWGYHFWEKDPYTKPNLKVGQGQDPLVVISGSGDGALQDFLRIVIGDIPARDIYDAVPLPPDLLLVLQSAQERGVRLFNWGCSAKHDHVGLDRLHQEVERVVADALRRGGSGLRQQLDRLLRKPVPSVRLLYECSHFSACYPINRFLALLFARYLEEDLARGPVLLGGRRVLDITSADSHRCQFDPVGCHGKAHDVAWVGLPDCRQGQTNIQGSLAANVLVIRHGIDLTDYTPPDPTPPLFRQLLPFTSVQ
jgi:FAD binding domain